MQERLLAEKLIGYDTSTPEGVRLCAGFIKGWFEARDIPTRQLTVRASHAAGLPALPGVATATEAQHALGEGLTWLKAFPASVLGTGWFPAMRGPFPQARFVATGGMDSSNARAFLDAGARVVAVGSALEDEAQLPALAALLG